MPVLDLAIEAERRSSVRITALLTGPAAVRLEEAAERAVALQVERILVKVDDGPAERVLPWLDRLAEPLGRIRGACA
jgi:hypothetical protein